MEIEKKHPTLGDYTLVKTLGSGYNSKVKLGYNVKDGKYYAVKVIRRTNIQANEKAIKTEVGIMKNLNHQNLIKLCEFQESVEYHKTNGSSFNVMYVVLELATGGELFEYVANGRFSEAVSRTYFHQLIEALEYLHGKNIAHRDLKPENLLFSEDFTLKLADFGFSTFMDRQLKTTLGTESYMAPEIHARQAYDGQSVDLFAAAIILFIMFAGSPPFSKADPKDPYYKLHCVGRLDTFWQAHSKHKNNKDFFPESFKNLFNAMVSYDPLKRLTLKQIKEHPWYNGEILSMDEIRKEFRKRKERVDSELEKQRMQKALEKERQKQKPKETNIAYTGVRGFRSLADEGKEFCDVEKVFEEELKLQRTIKIRDEQIPFNPQDFVSVCDADYLFKVILNTLLVSKAKNNDIANIQINNASYKIVAKFKDDEGEIAAEASICLNKLNEDSNIIEFNKKKGNAIVYYEKIAALKQEIDSYINAKEEKK